MRALIVHRRRVGWFIGTLLGASLLTGCSGGDVDQTPRVPREGTTVPSLRVTTEIPAPRTPTASAPSSGLPVPIPTDPQTDR